MTDLSTQGVVPSKQAYSKLKHDIPIGTMIGKMSVIEIGIIVPNKSGGYRSACRILCGGCGSEKIKRNDHLKHCKINTCGCGEHPKWRDDSDWRQVWCFSRHSARYTKGPRSRKIPVEFNISVMHVKAIGQLPCVYCGIEPSNILRRRITISDNEGNKRRILGPEIILKFQGIDRVNSSLGYIPGNCVPCCKFCNYAKQDSALTDFLNRLARFGSKLQEHEVIALATKIGLSV